MHLSAFHKKTGWMSVLNDIKTVERVAIVRCAVVLVVAAAAAWAYVAHQLYGIEAWVVLGCLVTNFIAATVMLTVYRGREMASTPHIAYIHSAIDVTMMTGVFIAGSLGSCAALVYAAQLAYVLFIAATGFRFQRKLSIFTAALAVGELLGVAALFVTGVLSSHLLSKPLLVVLTGVLILQGWFVSALARDAQQRVAVFEQMDRVFGGIINKISDGVLVCDVSATIVETNAAASDVLGLPREVLVGLDAFSVLPAPLAGELKVAWKEILANGIIVLPNIAFERHEQTVYVDVNAYRVRVGDDLLVHIMLRDTTVKRLLENRNSLSSKLVSLQAMRHSLVHELGNAFASLSVASYTLQQKLAPNDPLREETRIIQSTLDRTNALLQEIRDMTEEGKPRYFPVKVNDAITHALAAVDASPSVQVVVQVDPDIKQVLGDCRQLERVLVSLMRMALDAMLDGGTLTVGAQNVTVSDGENNLSGGDYVKIVIEDTGIGMPTNIVAESFKHSVDVGADMWSGIAMIDVRTIVQRYGGTIEIVSNLAHGTDYSVFWPATTEPAFSSDVPESVNISNVGGGVRLLVVDDEPCNRNSLGRLLKNSGYNVTLAEDGRRAIEQCENADGQFDLVLLDLVMPGLSGKDVLEVLLARWPELRVMFLTGFADYARVAECLKLGAVGYCMKPFDVSALLNKIQKICNHQPDG